MAEPRIQFAKTTDGVSIAYWTMGEGPPLVHTPGVPWGVGYTRMQIPEQRDADERFSTGRLVVRYDARGTGHSDRDATDFSLEAHLRDLEAVVERLSLEKFALLGFYLTGPAAIVYAARNPDRVTHLILHHAFASGSQFRKTTRYRAFDSLRLMARDEWDLYVRTMASAIFPGADEAILERLRQLMNESVRPAEVLRLFDAVESFDATEATRAIRAPTLILNRREAAFVSMELAKDLASRIPGAELVVLEGPSAIAGDDQMLRAINEFLGASSASPEGTRPGAMPAAFRTVLFTDIVGHTEMMQRLGDAKGRDVLREHERITRETLKAHGGAEVKTMGDGFMASFGSVTSAIECAIALQRAFAARTDTSSSTNVGAQPVAPTSEMPATPVSTDPAPPAASNIQHPTSNIQIRIGINAGEPIEEDGDLFGATVILASRIAARAGAGEILVPDTVRGLLSGKGFMFSDRGEFVPKGFDEGVRLWDVRWQEDA
jgi:class 3 adenylate cyclase/pimeloyl-ACP methyl ester carboxylesterase